MVAYSKQEALTLIREGVKDKKFKKHEVRFLLCSDVEIEGERRVGLTPPQIGQLKSVIEECGLSLKVYVVRGAGELYKLENKPPLYPDQEYEAAGAQLVDVDDLDSLRDVDVVHALKEPTSLEARLQDPFLRIGALHLAALPKGVSQLLEGKKFAALFDGSTVGHCSYRITGGDKNPVVASMSRIAGDLAAEHLLEDPELINGKVIIFGAGVAGSRAIVKLRDRIEELIVIEPIPIVQSYVNWLLLTLGFHRYRILEKLPEEGAQAVFQDAAGVIFASRRGAEEADLVCRMQDIKGVMKPNAGIVDIAIDQGGSIGYEAISQEDEIHTRISKYEDALQDYRYFAKTNMPKDEPEKSSRMHGHAILPYCAALLLLCAEQGSPNEAAHHILKRDERQIAPEDKLPADFQLDPFQYIVQDLRNGLELAVTHDAVSITHSDIEKNSVLVKWIQERSMSGASG